MKARKIKIRLQSPKEALDEFVEEAESRKKRKVKPEEESIELCFEDLSVFAKVFSSERLRLLKAVRHRKPASIKELAGMLGRDYPNVYNDVKFLAEQGILELEEKEGRGKGIVKPTFDWDGFDIAV